MSSSLRPSQAVTASPFKRLVANHPLASSFSLSASFARLLWLPLLLTCSLAACSTATAPTASSITPTKTTATASPQIQPTATGAPKGTVLYQANWAHGLDGWQASQGWRVVGGQLLVDSLAATSIIAPYRPPLANYAIEASIQVVRVLQASANSYNIFADNAAGRDGYEGGAIGLAPPPWGPAGVYAGFAQAAPNHLDASQGFNEIDFVPGPNWRTYRIEVQGNQLSFFIDGDRVDITYSTEATLSNGPIGLQSRGLMLRVSSFRITAL